MTAAARKPRYERQVASDRREALVDAAIESLKRFGYEGLSVRRIAAEAGVSIGLINHHFPNKDTLVAESYRTFSRRLAANFEKLGWQTGALIIDGAEIEAGFRNAARNIPNIDVLPIQGINVYDIMRRGKLVLTKAAIDALEARFK